MDVTKLFERTDDAIEPLELAKLDIMIERAIAYPQLQRPANQNPVWIKKAIAVAAAIVIAVTVSFQFLPVQELQNDSNQASVIANLSNDDVYGDVSDLLIMETMSDLDSQT